MALRHWLGALVVTLRPRFLIAGTLFLCLLAGLIVYITGRAAPVGASASDIRLLLDQHHVTLTAGTPLHLSAALVHQGPHGQLRVALPADGSDFRWRYPHCWWEVIGPDGQPAPRFPHHHCPKLQPLADDHFEQLQPGQALTLTDSGYLSLPTTYYNMLTPGRYQVRLHYSYRAPANWPHEQQLLLETPQVRQLASSCRELELVSEPVDVLVENTLHLSVEQTRPVPPDQCLELLDYFDLFVENRSQDFYCLYPCDGSLGSPGDHTKIFCHVTGEVSPATCDTIPGTPDTSDSSASTIILAPGQRCQLDLPGANSLTRVRFTRPGQYTLRLAYSHSPRSPTQEQIFLPAAPVCLTVKQSEQLLTTLQP